MNWQPIETAPKDAYARILLFSADDGVQIGLWSPPPYGGWFSTEEDRCGDAYLLTPTHWMPLPEPPK